VDTMVDPVEMLPPSSARMRAAAPAPPPAPPRGSLPSVDPDAQVQWFERMSFAPEPASSIDVEVAWEDDGEPTLVLTRPRRQ
jgi:hypothetical protein